MKKIISAILISYIIANSGCKVMQISDFNLEPALSSKLPLLERITDDNNSNSMYSMYPMAYPYYYGYYDGGISHDINILFNKELENITIPTGEKYGYVQFKTIIVQSGLRGFGFAFLTGLSLGILNLCGMPVGIAKTDIEVELDVLNSKKEIISQYKGEGKAKVSVAFYYGYEMMSAPRMANITAAKMALKSINTQIEKDTPMLKAKLLENGAIK